MSKQHINTTSSMKGQEEAGEAAQARNLSAEELKTLSKEDLIAMLTEEQAKGQMLEHEMARARAAGEAAALLTSNVIEVYAGEKEVEVETAKGVKETVTKEYWRYTMDLPPSAGQGITINGMPAYHGQTITVDTDTLRTVKEMVYRAWYHEQSIFGQANDNAFRQGYMNGGRVGAVLSPKGPGARAPSWASSRA